MTLQEKVFAMVNELLVDEGVISPELMAQRFWTWDAEQQANFFNILADVSRFGRKGEPVFTEMQWSFMTEYLTPEGKATLDAIKLHTDRGY